jgi:hypothetical protein
MLMVLISWIFDVDGVDSLRCLHRWQFKPILSPMYRYLGRYIDTSGLNNQYFTIVFIIDGINASTMPSCRCRCRNLSHRWHYHPVMMILSTMPRWLIPSLIVRRYGSRAMVRCACHSSVAYSRPGSTIDDERKVISSARLL